MHSQFSPDSNNTISDLITEGINKGLGGISITDHHDFDVPSEEENIKFNFDTNAQQKAIDEAIIGMHADFKVCKGIEIGIQEHCIEDIEKSMKSANFDIVLLSVHHIDGLDPYYGLYYKPYDYLTAYRHYLETIYACMKKFNNFDVLAHFDYIVRYAPYKESSILYKDFSDIIDEIFKFLIFNGKIFEINTKSYQKFGNRLVSLDSNILKRYVELGGEIVSFGSDSHTAGQVGIRFDEYKNIVKQNGIKYSVYFDKRKPQMIKL